MNTENLSTLKIHKLSQAQYNRELAAGNIDETALYLTPDDGSDWSQNDETSSGYIKNRTHYEQVIMEEISPTFSWEANSYIDGMVAIADLGIYEFSDMPTHYDITMFDKTYSNIKFGDVVKNTSGPSFNFMLKVDYAGTGYAITAYSSVSSGFYNTSDVSVTNIKKLVQLNEGYIPDTIARKTDISSMIDELHGANGWETISTVSNSVLTNGTWHNIGSYTKTLKEPGTYFCCVNMTFNPSGYASNETGMVSSQFTIDGVLCSRTTIPMMHGVDSYGSHSYIACLSEGDHYFSLTAYVTGSQITANNCTVRVIKLI